jgi:hypothetical protein
MKKILLIALATIFITGTANAACMDVQWYERQGVSLLSDAGHVARDAASNRLSDTDRAFLNQEFQAYLQALNGLTSLSNSCLSSTDLAYIGLVLNTETLGLTDADTLTREDAAAADGAVRTAIGAVRRGL